MCLFANDRRADFIDGHRRQQQLRCGRSHTRHTDEVNKHVFFGLGGKSKQGLCVFPHMKMGINRRFFLPLQRRISTERNLKMVVFGQDEAIKKLADTIKLSRAGLGAPDKPIGSFSLKRWHRCNGSWLFVVFSLRNRYSVGIKITV